MTVERKVPARNFGFSPEQIIAMRQNAENNVNNTPMEPVDWFAFLECPKEIPRLVIEQPGIYTFDILQFPLDILYHPFFASKEMRQYTLEPNTMWWERTVFVHENFPRQVVCDNTFGKKYNNDTKKFDNDPVCALLWGDNKGAYDYKEINKRYSVFLVRMHPNEIIGNKDYKLFMLVDSYGKFGKKVDEEYAIMTNTKDKENLSFYMYNHLGKSVKARFVSQEKVLPSRTGVGTKNVKFLSCDRIDFIDRKDQLTDDELDLVLNSHVDQCIRPYDQEACEEMAHRLMGKVDRNAPAKPVAEKQDVKEEDRIPMGAVSKPLEDTPFGEADKDGDAFDNPAKPDEEDGDDMNW